MAITTIMAGMIITTMMITTMTITITIESPRRRGRGAEKTDIPFDYKIERITKKKL